MSYSPSYAAYSQNRPESTRHGSHHLAADCAGMNFYSVDRSLNDLLRIYLKPEERRHFDPYFQRMGLLSGGRLNELSIVADRNTPVLHQRTRWGEDEDWIEYHPAYREMEQIAFGEFQFHAMSHRAGTLGYDSTIPHAAKYALQYLFVQSEFGQMCPISVTDTSTFLINKFGSQELKEKYLPRLLSDDMATLWKAAQFMTEKAGGSDVGAAETSARLVDGQWRLYGEKWFCSHADAEVTLLLARPEGAPSGGNGLAVFLMPRTLDDGTRNAYRIVRLKDKLGSRSMASGEIRIEGAVAFPVGDMSQGLKQMMHQVNLSRLSHGFRAASMMRRCLNEALQVARDRKAFGKTLLDYPLLQRQLIKLMIPTECALSVAMCAADTMRLVDEGNSASANVLRLLTPLLKLRACRDNITVATGAMEIRGGVGYTEDFVNSRLVRDAHIGVLWEGTSNMNALDVVQRAVAKVGAQNALRDMLLRRLQSAEAIPHQLRADLRMALTRAIELVETVARQPELEVESRHASTMLYFATSAILMAWEAVQPGADLRRLLLSKLVLQHHLMPSDPLATATNTQEKAIADLLLQPTQVAADRVWSLCV